MLAGDGKGRGLGEAGDKSASSLLWYGSSGGSDGCSTFMGLNTRTSALGRKWWTGLQACPGQWTRADVARKSGWDSCDSAGKALKKTDVMGRQCARRELDVAVKTYAQTAGSAGCGG